MTSPPKEHQNPPRLNQLKHSKSSTDLPIKQNGLKVVPPRIRERAQSASNFISGAPLNEIKTDSRGVVLDVTPEFLAFTGYDQNEMIGRKCNFLQGEGTDPGDVMELRSAMEKKRQTSVVILNYCKDGSPFWNILTIIPRFKANQPQLLDTYLGEVIHIPIPPSMRYRPRLCLDDALALISVYSSVPRPLAIANTYDDDDDNDNDDDQNGDRRIVIEEQDQEDQEEEETSDFHTDVEGDNEESDVTNSKKRENSKKNSEQNQQSGFYKHVNYGQRFATSNKQQKKSKKTKSKYSFIAETGLPTRQGRFRVRAYRNDETGAEPLAMIVGNIEGKENVVIRVHDQCVTSEVFGSLKCDCKEQLDFGLSYIQENETGGMVLYLPQEGRGIGLANKVAAYAAQEQGLDTVDANRHLGLPDDAREYDSVRDILADMRIKSVKVLTNNPRKIECMESLGIKITERISCIVVPNSDYSMKYVHSKAQRMGHMINVKSLTSSFEKESGRTTPPPQKPPRNWSVTPPPERPGSAPFSSHSHEHCHDHDHDHDHDDSPHPFNMNH